MQRLQGVCTCAHLFYVLACFFFVKMLSFYNSVKLAITVSVTSDTCTTISFSYRARLGTHVVVKGHWTYTGLNSNVALKTVYAHLNWVHVCASIGSAKNGL